MTFCSKKISGLLAALPLLMGVISCAHAQAPITERSYGDVAFKLQRLSSNESNYLKLPNAWAASYGSDAYKTLGVDRKIAQLVRLRVSQLKNCNYCEITHSTEAFNAGLSKEAVYSVASWRQSELFSAKEKAALFYAEALSNLNQDDIQKAYDGLNENGFTKADQEELTNCVILMEVWSRVFLAQGKTSYKK